MDHHPGADWITIRALTSTEDGEYCDLPRVACGLLALLALNREGLSRSGAAALLTPHLSTQVVDKELALAIVIRGVSEAQLNVHALLRVRGAQRAPADGTCAGGGVLSVPTGCIGARNQRLDGLQRWCPNVLCHYPTCSHLVPFQVRQSPSRLGSRHPPRCRRVGLVPDSLDSRPDRRQGVSPLPWDAPTEDAESVTGHKSLRRLRRSRAGRTRSAPSGSLRPLVVPAMVESAVVLMRRGPVRFRSVQCPDTRVLDGQLRSVQSRSVQFRGE